MTTAPGDDCYKQFTPTFVSIDNNKVTKLSMIKFSVGDLANGDSIQVFDPDGELDYELDYYKDKTVSGVKKTGWFLEGKTFMEDFDFTPGQSVWICTASEVGMTESGAVNPEPVVINLPGDDCYAQGGIACPRNVKLGEITFSETLSNGDSIQFFDADGELEYELDYYKDKTVSGVKKTGWFLEGSQYCDPETYELEAGLSFWVCTAKEGTMTIPAAVK